MLYPVELRALNCRLQLVGVVGFELTTLCSQSRCATRLRYAPTARILTCFLTGSGFKGRFLNFSKLAYYEKPVQSFRDEALKELKIIA